MGDQAVMQFVLSVQFLPMVKMFVLMCPKGAEGSSYAMLTTMSKYVVEFLELHVEFGLNEILFAIFSEA